ncbi:MAG: ArnT family glycosyltransferase [Planctomycetota bacterium]|jgi:4-amino-4-deoxy-L-arabinose transferase-like glycosyltransferase
MSGESTLLLHSVRGVGPGRDRITPVVVCALALLALLTAVRIYSHVSYPFAVDIGEGVVIDSVWAAHRGEHIYNFIGEKPPYVLTVYNPLLVYIGDVVVSVVGPRIWALRTVAVAFHLGCALVLYLFARRETGSRAAGLVGALFFLVERHIYYRAGYFVTDWPALFFSLLGLYLWRRGGHGRYVAVFSFALAFLSKQPALVAAAAAFVSLFLEKKRVESVLLAVGFALLIAAGIAGCVLLFGEAYLVNIFRYASIAPFLWSNALYSVGVTLVLYFVPVISGFFFARRAFRDPRLILPVVYFAFAFVTAFAVGRLGASRSYLFDLAAALSILVALVWRRVMEKARWGRLNVFLGLVLVAQLFLIALGTGYRLRPHGDKTRSDLAKDIAISEAFQSTDGVILTRETGFYFNSRAKPMSNDPYKIYLMINAGYIPPDTLSAPVRDKDFSLVIMPLAKEPWALFEEGLRREVLLHYEPVKEASGLLFLTPRTTDTSDD